MRSLGLALAMLVLGASAAAQSYTATVFIDSDNNTATGCTVVTPNGNVTGVEARLDAGIILTPPNTAGATATVDTQTVRRCTGGVFGAPQAVPAGFPTAVVAADGSLDRIELGGFHRSLVNASTSAETWAMAYYMERGGTSSSDLVASTAVPNFMPAMLSDGPVPVPGLGWPALGMLLAAVAWFASRRLGSSHGLRSFTLLVLACSFASAVWAAAITLDGQTGDWASSPAIATDPGRDALGFDANVEMVAVHATSQGSTAYFRIDVVPSRCTVSEYVGLGFDIAYCSKGNTMKQDYLNDGSFEGHSVILGTAPGPDGMCPAGTDYGFEDVADYLGFEPIFYAAALDHGFSEFADLCFVN